MTASTRSEGTRENRYIYQVETETEMAIAITAQVKPGDHGKDIAEVTIGDITITVYESARFPGRTVVDVDTWSEGSSIEVTVNDGVVFQESPF